MFLHVFVLCLRYCCASCFCVLFCLLGLILLCLLCVVGGIYVLDLFVLFIFVCLIFGLFSSVVVLRSCVFICFGCLLCSLLGIVWCVILVDYYLILVVCLLFAGCFALVVWCFDLGLLLVLWIFVFCLCLFTFFGLLWLCAWWLVVSIVFVCYSFWLAWAVGVGVCFVLTCVYLLVFIFGCCFGVWLRCFVVLVG